jgi:tetratricopeptide (TPR) repeat protein
MPSKEIKELRDSGKLEEALAMAKSEFDATPDNIWAKRNLAWVYYGFLKRDQGSQDAFLPMILKVLELKSPKDEVMFYEQLCWVIGGHNFQISKSELSNTDKFNAVNSIFETIKPLKIEQSKGHSFLLKSFHNAFKEISSNDNFNNNNVLNTSKSYVEVFQWAGFESFLSEDFEPFETNGRKIMSFVEQVIIAYAKVLLKGEYVEDDGIMSAKINEEKTEFFLNFVDIVIEEHPDFQYSLYYKSKLLLGLERFKEAKKSLIPFVKKKKNDFWVWDLLGEAYGDDEDIQIACLCKALTLNTKESFLVKVHQKLADLLVGKELYKEASVEVLNSISIRKKNDWKINNELIKYTHLDWFIKEVNIKGNKNFYEEQSILAEELLYNNHEEIVIVIDFVNTSKKMVNFIKDKNTTGFFSYKHLKMKPKIGDIYKARLNPIGEDGFYKVLTFKSSLNTDSEVIKKVLGNLRIAVNRDFGFINDNFVSPDLIKKHKLKDGDDVSSKVILSFNKKKNEWGWRVFTVNQ